MLSTLLNPRQRSLLRGSIVVLASLFAALRLSGFPQNRPTLLLLIPTLTSVIGTVDTLRCMRSRWSFYHGGVLLCVYMDLMVFCMILFFLLYPYTLWLAEPTH